MQYESGAQSGSSGWPQAASFDGQRLELVLAQLGEGAVRPTHTSQGSHAFKHDFTCVQGGQASGSPTCAASQVPPPWLLAPIHTNFPLSAGSSQQPKQSQPLGVMGRQNARQASACAVSSSEQVEPLPGTIALGA